MRRLARASSRCCGSGHARDVEHVVEHAHGARDDGARTPSKSNRACGVNASLTKRVRLMLPRQQQPYGGSGCSPHGLVASMCSQYVQVVVGVHAVDEQHAGLGVVVGRAHDLRPQIARARTVR